MFDKQTEEQAKKLENSLKKARGVIEGFEKVTGELQKNLLSMTPLASKKIITPNGVAVATLHTNKTVKIEFGSEASAKENYDSLQEFNPS